MYKIWNRHKFIASLASLTQNSYQTFGVSPTRPAPDQHAKGYCPDLVGSMPKATGIVVIAAAITSLFLSSANAQPIQPTIEQTCEKHDGFPFKFGWSNSRDAQLPTSLHTIDISKKAEGNVLTVVPHNYRSDKGHQVFTSIKSALTAIPVPKGTEVRDYVDQRKSSKYPIFTFKIHTNISDNFMELVGAEIFRLKIYDPRITKDGPSWYDPIKTQWSGSFMKTVIAPIFYADQEGENPIPEVTVADAAWFNPKGSTSKSDCAHLTLTLTHKNPSIKKSILALKPVKPVPRITPLSQIKVHFFSRKFRTFQISRRHIACLDQDGTAISDSDIEKIKVSSTNNHEVIKFPIDFRGLRCHMDALTEDGVREILFRVPPAPQRNTGGTPLQEMNVDRHILPNTVDHIRILKTGEKVWAIAGKSGFRTAPIPRDTEILENFDIRSMQINGENTVFKTDPKGIVWFNISAKGVKDSIKRDANNTLTMSIRIPGFQAIDTYSLKLDMLDGDRRRLEITDDERLLVWADFPNRDQLIHIPEGLVSRLHISTNSKPNMSTPSWEGDHAIYFSSVDDSKVSLAFQRTREWELASTEAEISGNDNGKYIAVKFRPTQKSIPIKFADQAGNRLDVPLEAVKVGFNNKEFPLNPGSSKPLAMASLRINDGEIFSVNVDDYNYKKTNVKLKFDLDQLQYVVRLTPNFEPRDIQLAFKYKAFNEWKAFDISEPKISLRDGPAGNSHQKVLSEIDQPGVYRGNFRMHVERQPYVDVNIAGFKSILNKELKHENGKNHEIINLSFSSPLLNVVIEPNRHLYAADQRAGGKFLFFMDKLHYLIRLMTQSKENMRSHNLQTSIPWETAWGWKFIDVWRANMPDPEWRKTYSYDISTRGIDSPALRRELEKEAQYSDQGTSLRIIAILERFRDFVDGFEIDTGTDKKTKQKRPRALLIFVRGVGFSDSDDDEEQLFQMDKEFGAKGLRAIILGFGTTNVPIGGETKDTGLKNILLHRFNFADEYAKHSFNQTMESVRPMTERIMGWKK